MPPPSSRRIPMRDILHLAIPAFPVALARALDPALRGRPAAVAPPGCERALVACASAEARAEGVEAGMPVSLARRLCPSLRLLPPDPALLARGGRALAEVASRYTPLWEPAAPGRLFLDLTGCSSLWGPRRDAAMRVEREISSRLRLPGSVGGAGNKLVSRIAAGCLAKPGICDVVRGGEREFIAPLPVTALPGVGRAREALLLRDLSLRLVEELAALPLPRLRLVFGPFAPLLRARARGEDPSPVLPLRRSPELVEDAVLSAEDNDDGPLLAELARLVEAVGGRLRRAGRAAARLALTVTYSDGREERAASDLPSPLDADFPLFGAAEELFRRACSRRVRVKRMRLACPLPVPRAL